MPERAGAAGGDDDVGGHGLGGGAAGPVRPAGAGFGVLQGGEPFGVAVADFHLVGADPAEHVHHAGELGAEGVAYFAWSREPRRRPPRNR